MTAQVGSRVGQDSYPRITTSTEMLMEASEVLPYEPMYQTLVPFVPPTITTGGSGALSSSSSGNSETDWKEYPDRLDLHVYQGDDVQIPLYFRNPADPALDMSNENGWEWKAQIRLLHRYWSRLVNEFSIETEYLPPDPPEMPTTAATLVTLFLPRMHNQYAGRYRWDLYSTSPYSGPVFPPPEGVDPWPMEDQIKTWLYGWITVVPRVTETDQLPVPSPGGMVAHYDTTVMGPGGMTVGPNGRVP